MQDHRKNDDCAVYGACRQSAKMRNQEVWGIILVRQRPELGLKDIWSRTSECLTGRV